MPSQSNMLISSMNLPILMQHSNLVLLRNKGYFFSTFLQQSKKKSGAQMLNNPLVFLKYIIENAVFPN